MIKAIVVDDEAPSREVMTNYLRDYCKDVEVTATASSLKTAYRAIRKHNPDVVFLDIELPDGKGFDLLQMFSNINFRVVFVTAYSEYAIRAFRVNAADYLLKPVKIDELNAAVEKIRAENKWSYDPEKFTGLLKTLTESSVVQPSIVVPNIKGFEVLRISEIIMCKADGYCTNLHLEGNRKVTSSKNLKHYEELLREHNIIRVHNSYLVNISHVQSFTRQGEIMLTESNKAFLGDSFRNSFLGRFNRKKPAK
ncbi:MAG: LytTR family DNA-binding domain-containing protein [Bacteroidales bacterium]|jgi:two-component system LytT family response regulator|nr:LytTR family DNA-binding domain-containing protein [Bacteroidales bacterium]